jgi:CheY-like chemotaxis protein
VNQMVAQRLLNNLGCSVDVACDGVEAINILERSDAYDIIFMDCHMPVSSVISLSCFISWLSQCYSRFG